MGKLIVSEDAQHCVQDAPNAAVVQTVGGGIERNMNALNADHAEQLWTIAEKLVEL